MHRSDHVVYDATPRSARTSWRLLPLILSVPIVILMVAGLVALSGAARYLTPEGRAAIASEELHRQAVAEQLQPVEVATRAGWALLPLLVAAGSSVVLLAAAWRWLASREALLLHHQARIASAIHTPGQTPHTLTLHAPRAGVPTPAQLPGDVSTPEEIRAPSFSELLDSGAIAPGAGGRLLLGYGAGGALHGSLKSLYSTAIGGLSGSGKSTSLRFFATQTVMVSGARMIVIDPHAEAGEESLAATLEPLRSRFACEVASSERQIRDTLRYALEVGRRRVAGLESHQEPLLVWVDEATMLLGHSTIGPELASALEQIAQQFRKVNVFATLSAQTWIAERSGGSSALRDSLASVIAHRMKRSQARLLVPAGEAALCERLETGHALLYRTSGESEVVSIPNTSARDVERVARLLGASDLPPRSLPTAAATGATLELGRHLGGTSEASGGNASSASRSAAPLPPEAARVVEAFVAGEGVPEILRSVYGLTSSGSRAWSERRTEVEAILRATLGARQDRH